jgi:hypothetical protein
MIKTKALPSTMLLACMHGLHAGQPVPTQERPWLREWLQLPREDQLPELT